MLVLFTFGPIRRQYLERQHLMLLNVLTYVIMNGPFRKCVIDRKIRIRKVTGKYVTNAQCGKIISEGKI